MRPKNKINKEVLLREFNDVLGVSFSIEGLKSFSKLEDFLSKAVNVKVLDKQERKLILISLVRQKFKLNSVLIASFLSHCAGLGVTFNYHEKKKINEAFDSNSKRLLEEVMESKKIPKSHKHNLFHYFLTTSEDETITFLKQQLQSPTLTRKDSRPKDQEASILSSLFGAFIFRIFPSSSTFSINSSSTGYQYFDNFWESLHLNYPEMFNRENSLTFININKELSEEFIDYESLLGTLCAEIKKYYDEICNHGHLAILIDNFKIGERPVLWQLFGDLILFSEKFEDVEPKKNYYKKEIIERNTKSYIKNLDQVRSNFNKIQIGFYYQDCFIFGEEDEQKILLLFQKNVNDETLIPCPACGSECVRGNSYPKLGVKSWECQNQLCPDRSKFNRGKRFSFLQLLKQEAIENIQNSIPPESVYKWSRDIQDATEIRDIANMLITHYTLSGDTIKFVNYRNIETMVLTRLIKTVDLQRSSNFDENLRFFEQSPFFYRYLVEKETVYRNQESFENKDYDGVKAIHGDAFEVLPTIANFSIDAAVTSPPYYNAREYSQWDNIYTYLYDMYNINKLVFKVLKSGAYYLYNIFDYFDNEKTIALSTMGEKRMILASYTINMFNRIGFECVGNIAWDKGHIEGKRGFNNGNFSPYYQAPFNCWEHILVFRKPCNAPLKTEGTLNFPTVLKQKPVFKLVNGENIHGHTAPFPEEIPDLIISQLNQNSVILDPFAGSMTTGVVAKRYGCKAINIERNEQYYNLGCSNLSKTHTAKQFQRPSFKRSSFTLLPKASSIFDLDTSKSIKCR